MAQTVNSKQKVAFCVNLATEIADTRKKIAAKTEDVKAVAGVAKMAATDRIYNGVAELSTQFNEALTKSATAALDLLQEIKANANLIGEDFNASVTKAIGEVEGVLKADTYAPISAARDGEEKWTDKEAEQLQSALTSYLAVRRTYIENLAAETKKIDDEGFVATTRVIGKANEEFTNSIAAFYKKLQAEIDTLNGLLGKQAMNLNDIASSMNIGTADVKVSVTGGSI